MPRMAVNYPTWRQPQDAVPAGPGGDRPLHQRTSTRSTTKISVSPGLIAGACAAVAVAEVRRDDEPAAAADLHARHALVPAGDDLAGAERERERLAAVPGGVELLAGGVGDADVVHDDGVAGRGLGAVARRRCR